jgi:hypothetical protein
MMPNPLSDFESLANLAEVARSAPEPIALVLEQTTAEGEFRDRLASVAKQVHNATSGAIQCSEQTSEGEEPTAALFIQHAGRDIIRYQAVPEGPEEAPFLEALTALTGGAGADSAGAKLRDSSTSVEILVFVAPGCPNCPHGVRAAIQTALANENVAVSIVDAGEFVDYASLFEVRSVPTTVVNGEFTIVGVVRLEELVQSIDALSEPDAEDLILVSLMKSGRIADATAKLVEGKGIAAFADLWNNSTLEQRIGLSLAAQNAVDEDPAALDPMVELILPSLHSDDGARRGDTADLLGAIAHESARHALERLLEDDDEDIAEAAQDALECIDERATASNSH